MPRSLLERVRELPGLPSPAEVRKISNAYVSARSTGVLSGNNASRDGKSSTAKAAVLGRIPGILPAVESAQPIRLPRVDSMPTSLELAKHLSALRADILEHVWLHATVEVRARQLIENTLGAAAYAGAVSKQLFTPRGPTEGRKHAREARTLLTVSNRTSYFGGRLRAIMLFTGPTRDLQVCALMLQESLLPCCTLIPWKLLA